MDNIGHLDMIDCLNDQIASLLDLMQCSEDTVDIQSIRTASGMCANMLVDMMKEIDALELADELKRGAENEKRK